MNKGTMFSGISAEEIELDKKNPKVEILVLDWAFYLVLSQLHHLIFSSPHPIILYIMFIYIIIIIPIKQTCLF